MVGDRDPDCDGQPEVILPLAGLASGLRTRGATRSRLSALSSAATAARGRGDDRPGAGGSRVSPGRSLGPTHSEPCIGDVGSLRLFLLLPPGITRALGVTHSPARSPAVMPVGGM